MVAGTWRYVPLPVALRIDRSMAAMMIVWHVNIWPTGAEPRRACVTPALMLGHSISHQACICIMYYFITLLPVYIRQLRLPMIVNVPQTGMGVGWVGGREREGGGTVTM